MDPSKVLASAKNFVTSFYDRTVTRSNGLRVLVARWQQPRALAIVILCSLSGLAACDRPVPFDGTGPREAAERAMARITVVASQDAQRLRALIDEASSLEMDPKASAEDRAVAWAEALIAVREFLVAEQRQRALDEQDWREIESRAERAVLRAETQSAGPGLERQEARWVEQARYQLEQARKLADLGQPSAAILAARQALDHAQAVDDSWREQHARFSRPELIRQWRQWATETINQSRRDKKTVLVIDKLARRLDVFRGGKRLESFVVELGSRGLARKLHAGDRATPEGRYKVVQVKSGAATRYYKALLIDYPNSDDRQRYRAAQRQGQISKRTGIGSLIEIHGHGGQGRDWTDGCVALTNKDMDRLFSYVEKHMLVTIVGTLKS